MAIYGCAMMGERRKASHVKAKVKAVKIFPMERVITNVLFVKYIMKVG